MIRRLAGFFGKYKKYAILGPIFITIDIICELLMPLLMSQIVDVGIVNEDTSYILRIGLIMIGLAVVAIICGVMNMFCSSRAAQGFGANIRKGVFEKIQKFSFLNIDTFSTGSLITRLTSDANTLQQTVLMGLRIMIRSPLQLLVAAFLAISINAQLALILLVVLPILGVAMALILSKAFPRFLAMQEKTDAFNNRVQENLTNIRVVKSFVRQDYEKEKFKKSNDELTEASLRAVSLAILAMPVMMMVMNIATIMVIWFGGNMVMVGGMAPGELTAFISYIMQILMSVMMVAMVFMMVIRSRASAERIVEVLDTEVDIVDDAMPLADGSHPTVQTGSVEFKNVCFKYDKNAEEFVLKDIDFAVQPGEMIAVIGSTGSAKSTLVNLIPRLYEVTEGAVLVDGEDVRSYRLEDLRDGIGVVLQNNVLFSGTIKENIKWGMPDATDEQVIEAAKAAQAHEFIMAFPDGYDTMIERGGTNVSGGQRQRLCIARALIKHPPILILDDSTSAVDTTTEGKIQEAFAEKLQDTTVFLIAQRISSVLYADRIVILDDGRVVGLGTHDELMESNEIYQEIVA
ncbi:ABC transporter ATP-binding protein/permease, partial [Eubacteriales bacterium OttesenSCG-928-N14]|nr:ABC transporter ATP-binding protein/permease [Eubacteriales bacterium OttesenSCG-928-N14]